MAAELTLFGMSRSPLALRIEWALKYKGLRYDYIDEDLNNKSPRLLMHNPVHKQIPVLLHGGKPIAESLVILEYIDETWTQNPMLPKDAYERAMARFWAKFGDDTCLKTMKRVFSSTGEEQESFKKEVTDSLKILNEKALNGNKFFGGESIGFLDIVLGWIAFWTPFVEDITGLKLVDETSMPALKAWFNTFLSVPWVKEILPPQEKLHSHLKAFREKLVVSKS